MSQLTFCPEQHIINEAKQLYSPNFDARPEEGDINLLVIHCISLPPNEFGTGKVEQFFLNQLNTDEHPYYQRLINMSVSSHLFIDRDGRITQFVPFNKRAWHAGASSFEGVGECNDYSIGIELEGSEEIPYTLDQYQSLSRCTNLILENYPAITPNRIVGHCDIAPARKTDPGPSFDWVQFKQSLKCA